MASPGPKAIGYLELNIDGFDKAIKSAKNLLGGLAAGFAGFKVGEFFKDGIKDAIDFGKEMQNASRIMAGFDPGYILLVQKALENTGMGAQEAQGHINDFIKSGRDISEIFMGADNYAAALKDASTDFGAQAGVLTRSGKDLQTVWNTIGSISSKVRTFFLTMTEQFVKPLQVALDYINEIDLSEIGSSFGKAIGTAATTIIGIFKNGDIINALKAGIEYAFYAGIDILMTGFQKCIAFFNAAMESISESFRKSFFADDMITLMKDVFKGLGEIISSAILKSVSAAASALGMTGAGETLNTSSAQDFNASKNHFNSVSNIIHDTDFLKAGFDSADAIKAGFDAASKVNLGQSESGLKAKETWNTMREMIEKGFSTGIEMEKNAGKGEKPPKVVSDFNTSGGRYVIADNLAKVGGGGGYLKVALTLSERTAIEQLKAQQQSEKTLQAIQKNTESKPQPVTLAR
jgi:hypothetical protein